jgi:hypothetical protein
LIWAAISGDGPESLQCGKENSQLYLSVLEESLPDIGVFIISKREFMQDGAKQHSHDQKIL